MTATARCVLLGDVPTGDGRTLRVAIMVEASGEETLILAVGSGEGPAWREDPAEGIILPMEAIPGLLRALGAVSEEM